MKKILSVFAMFFAFFASPMFAAVTVDTTSGVVSGTLDVAPFLSMFGVIIVAVAVMWAAKRALGLISK